MTLSESQKKYLRGLGHDLKPVIMVGDSGLTESLLAEFESTLAHHELIKVSVRVGERQVARRHYRDALHAASASLIQRIGNVALLYRPNLKKSLEKRIRLPSR